MFIRVRKSKIWMHEVMTSCIFRWSQQFVVRSQRLRMVSQQFKVESAIQGGVCNSGWSQQFKVESAIQGGVSHSRWSQQFRMASQQLTLRIQQLVLGSQQLKDKSQQL
ncbi:hypothetical protein CEF21_07215 [Bacillus sp. FJAT-42376]|nr:hypothetical protein CEF21_07215 [Bacillus sp. FJAT-42376]